MDLADYILADIEDHARRFLPGPRPKAEEIRENFDGALLVDNLDSEEALLILSTLPADSSNFFLAPLDKGLSGAAVFSARYVRPNGQKSKPFVLKLGDREKIEREAEAIERFVAPTLRGVTNPITRLGPSRGLLVQDLAGINDRSDLDSLRNVVRTSDDGATIIDVLLRERLSPWYDARSEILQEKYEVVFAAHLGKGPRPASELLPEGWEQYPVWAESMGLVSQSNLHQTVELLRTQSVRTPKSTIHGDLHTQNVLVETTQRLERQCWPIDFAWTTENGSPLVDLVMLECSLKFLTIPMRSELGNLCEIETLLSEQPFPEAQSFGMPYSIEINRVLNAIREVRSFALDDLGISFGSYQRALFLMTYSLLTHPGLNQPFVYFSASLLNEQVA